MKRRRREESEAAGGAWKAARWARDDANEDIACACVVNDKLEAVFSGDVFFIPSSRVASFHRRVQTGVYHLRIDTCERRWRL
jgi:hypothetical protein